MFRIVLIILVTSLSLEGCLGEITTDSTEKSEQAKLESDPGETENLGRELGTLVSIYPIPLPDGDYDLELQMTKDTVLVAFEEAKEFAADSVGHALFLSTAEPFYTLDGKCFYSPKKESCLDFRKKAKKK